MKQEFSKDGHPTQYLRRFLVQRQQGRCYDCDTEEWTQDNVFDIHRLQEGGEYHPDNCVLICRKCHLIRHPRQPWSKKKSR